MRIEGLPLREIQKVGSDRRVADTSLRLGVGFFIYFLPTTILLLQLAEPCNCHIPVPLLNGTVLRCT
jgi:hypothetical protein